MEETKKKPLTTAEIIILVVAVILLIAFIVTSVIIVGKKNDEIKAINQQLVELKEKVDGIVIPSGITSADVESAIAEAIENIKIPEQGLSEEQVKAIVEAAIAGIVIPEGGLTEAEVKTIIEAAIAGIEVSEGGLSKAQVQAIVDAAIKGIKIPESGLTEAQVKKLVTDALKNIDTGLTEAEVEAIIKEILDSQQEDIDAFTIEEKLSNGEHVMLTEDYAIGYSVDVPAGSDIVIDLNGKTLTIPEGVRLAFFGKAKIIGYGAIHVEANYDKKGNDLGVVVMEGADLSLRNVSMTVSETGAYCISNHAGGNVDIKGGNFGLAGEADSSEAKFLVFNNGTMAIESATFINHKVMDGFFSWEAVIWNAGEMKLTNVTVNSYGDCVSTAAGATTTVIGGNFISENGLDFHVYPEGTLIVE